jgi:hypothetical protein
MFERGGLKEGVRGKGGEEAHGAWLLHKWRDELPAAPAPNPAPRRGGEAIATSPVWFASLCRVSAAFLGRSPLPAGVLGASTLFPAAPFLGVLANSRTLDLGWGPGVTKTGPALAWESKGPATRIGAPASAEDSEPSNHRRSL